MSRARTKPRARTKIILLAVVALAAVAWPFVLMLRDYGHLFR